MPKPQQRRAPRFLLRYLLGSLAPLLVLAGAIEVLTQREVDRAVASEATAEAEGSALALLSSLVGVDEAGATAIGEAGRAAIAAAASAGAAGGRPTAIRVWSTDGRLLADSSDPTRVTALAPFERGYFDAVAGATAAHPGPPAGFVVPPALTTAPDLVTVHVPLRAAADPADPAATRPVRAVAEVVVGADRTPFVATAHRLRTVLLAGIVALWALTGVLMGSVTHALRRSDRAHRTMALYDQLTGLPNRRHFTEEAGAALEALGAHGQPAAFVLLDVAGFTEINRALGREHGDDVLRQVAVRLQGMVQPGQVVARMGGDVFGLLLPGIDAVTARRQVAVVRTVLEAEVEVAGIPVSFEAVMGIAAFPGDGPDAGVVLQRAEIAMVAAKAAGVEALAFSPELDEADPARLGLAVELRRAIARDELFLVYQPKVHLADLSMRSAEALVRWRHPERGMVPPVELIGVAEATGLIVPLTAWVVEQAIAQTAHWARNGLPMRVAINVSARNLRDDRFADQVVRVLNHHRLPPAYIELEITETAIVTDAERVARTVRRLRDAGIPVALDDFGQGSTSLAHLRNLPLHTLKIDKCFVDGICRDAVDAAVVRNMITLGHELGLEVVAEGVEHADQHATLAAWGCDVGQGFYFERPLSVSELTERYGPPPAEPVPAPVEVVPTAAQLAAAELAAAVHQEPWGVPAGDVPGVWSAPAA